MPGKDLGSLKVREFSNVSEPVAAKDFRLSVTRLRLGGHSRWSLEKNKINFLRSEVCHEDAGQIVRLCTLRRLTQVLPPSASGEVSAMSVGAQADFRHAGRVLLLQLSVGHWRTSMIDH